MSSDSLLHFSQASSSGLEIDPLKRCSLKKVEESETAGSTLSDVSQLESACSKGLPACSDSNATDSKSHFSGLNSESTNERSVRSASSFLFGLPSSIWGGSGRNGSSQATGVPKSGLEASNASIHTDLSTNGTKPHTSSVLFGLPATIWRTAYSVMSGPFALLFRLYGLVKSVGCVIHHLALGEVISVLQSVFSTLRELVRLSMRLAFNLQDNNNSVLSEVVGITQIIASTYTEINKLYIDLLQCF